MTCSTLPGPVFPEESTRLTDLCRPASRFFIESSQPQGYSGFVFLALEADRFVDCLREPAAFSLLDFSVFNSVPRFAMPCLQEMGKTSKSGGNEK
jgi:hypothetical protein